MHPTEPAADRLASLVRSVRIPQSMRDALAPDPSDPEPGQIWRLRWAETTELAAITRVAVEGVRAFPIEIGNSEIDDQSLMLKPSQNSLEVATAAWTGLERDVPMHVLDRPIGRVEYNLRAPAWIDKALADGARRGHEPVSRRDPIITARAQLDDHFSEFAVSSWAPTGEGNLAELLAAVGIERGQLGEALRLSKQQVLALYRGKRPVSDDQARLLEQQFGLDAQRVLDANPTPPQVLVQEMSRPKWRAKVGNLALDRRVDELTAWVQATFGIASHAYRQTGTATVPSWEPRVERYFQATLK
jgi:hypothetical protein